MRRSFLYVLIVSVVVSALLGILALLSRSFGETEIKVLLSTLCVAGASILAMACSAVLEKGRARAFAVPGILASILGFLLLLVGIWGESEAKVLWRSAGTLVTLGTFCAHGALLVLARLAERFRWVQPATIIATGWLGLLLVYQIWTDGGLEDAWRWVGICAILGTAGTILTAVFQRMSRDASRREAPGTGASLHCPHCGKTLPASFRLDA